MWVCSLVAMVYGCESHCGCGLFFDHSSGSDQYLFVTILVSKSVMQLIGKNRIQIEIPARNRRLVRGLRGGGYPVGTGNVTSVCVGGDFCAKIPAVRTGSQNPSDVLFRYSKVEVRGGTLL